MTVNPHQEVYDAITVQEVYDAITIQEVYDAIPSHRLPST